MVLKPNGINERFLMKYPYYKLPNLEFPLHQVYFIKGDTHYLFKLLNVFSGMSGLVSATWLFAGMGLAKSRPILGNSFIKAGGIGLGLSVGIFMLTKRKKYKIHGGPWSIKGQR